MNKVSIPEFSASIVIGLQKGYTDDCYSKSDVVSELQQYQKSRIKEDNQYLSASVTECDVVLNDQIEPHLKIEFINYPRFELKPADLKNEIIKLGKHLMKQFHQNRIVIVFHDETLMIENNEEVDPRVKGRR